MDLSVIIVSWNTKALLAVCLETTVRGLAGLDAEIIVVDNASEDGSPDMVAERFPGVRLLRNECNVGFAAANNQAMAIARGRHVLLLNSDTEVRGDVLRAMVRQADAHPAIGALGCRVLNPDGSLQPTCFRAPWPGRLLAAAVALHKIPLVGRLGDERMRHWRRDDERDVDVVTGCCLLARREAIEAVGPLDEQFFFYGEETDWCLRLRRAGWAVRFAPVGEIIHHGGASAARLDVRRDLLLAEAIVRLHRKHRGGIAAAAAWALLALRHALRAGAWAGAAAMPGRRAEAWDRAARHGRIFFRLGEAWTGRGRAHVVGVACPATVEPVDGRPRRSRKIVARRGGRAVSSASG
jgi:GT2 family glycosyltransferase